MFTIESLDETNQIPLPYGVEKFNFNPFELQGDLTFKRPTDPNSFSKPTKNGKIVDKKGRQINKQGFLLDSEGNLINRNGVVRFSAAQLAPFGGCLPQLYIYSGKKFDVNEIIGVFDRDARGKIKLIKKKDKNGKDIFVDKGGYQVNSRGYIINSVGHICTRGGRKLFHREHLKSGEPPKFFPFTRFNAKRI